MTRRPRLDRACAEAVDLARSAAEETGEGVGEHLSAEAEADRVVTHLFSCTLRGYRGWRWAVVVARASRSRTVTVSEVALLPGPDALIAPSWVPWSERLRAGDVGVGDLLPTDQSDPRLMPGYVLSDDDAVEDIAVELGVGRPRVMTRDGRIETAERWYEGDHGPHTEITTQAPVDARCGTCGFYLPMAGSLRQMFGVCGNLYASDDGRVVSADHGCGAHSEVLSAVAPESASDSMTETAYDDTAIEELDTGSEPAEPETVKTAEEEASTGAGGSSAESAAEVTAAGVTTGPVLRKRRRRSSARDDERPGSEPAAEGSVDTPQAGTD